VRDFQLNRSQSPQRQGSAEAGEERKLLTYPVLRFEELLALNPDARVPILSDSKNDYWFKGTPAFILGPGGVGKSRWVLSLAVSDILGREFCGFKTNRAGRWLIIGTENDEHRAQSDLLRIVAGWGLSPGDHALIQENLFQTAHGVQSPMPETDLGEDNVVASLMQLAEKYKPDVVVVDPWEAFIAGADVNDSRATRRSLGKLAEIFRPATPLIVHHAREGAEATKGAFGFGASAFAKGSKTAATMARFAINITSKSSNLETDEEHGLVISCGKSNNSRPFPVRAVIMGSNGVYRVDEDFDVRTYLDDVDGKRRKQAVTIQQVVDIVRRGVVKTGELVDAVHTETGATRATTYRVLQAALKGNYLTQSGKGVYALGTRADCTIQKSK
jgi:RecA-family ATPase